MASPPSSSSRNSRKKGSRRAGGLPESEYLVSEVLTEMGRDVLPEHMTEEDWIEEAKALFQRGTAAGVCFLSVSLSLLSVYLS